MPYLSIKENAEFHSELDSAGNDLVVVNFEIAGIWPCEAIRGCFEEFASRYAGKSKFMVVDADRCKQVAVEHEVFSVPLIKFYRNGEELGSVANANPGSLEQKIKMMLIQLTPGLKPADQSNQPDQLDLPWHSSPVSSMNLEERDFDVSMELGRAGSDLSKAAFSTNDTAESIKSGLSKMAIQKVSLHLGWDLVDLLRAKQLLIGHVIKLKEHDLTELFSSVFDAIKFLAGKRNEYYPHEEASEGRKSVFVEHLVREVLDYIKLKFPDASEKLKNLQVEGQVCCDGSLVGQNFIKADFVVSDLSKPLHFLPVECKQASSGAGVRQLAVYLKQIYEMNCKLHGDRSKVYGLSSDAIYVNLLSFHPDEGYKLSSDMEFMFGRMFKEKQLWVEKCSLIVRVTFSALCEMLKI